MTPRQRLSIVEKFTVIFEENDVSEIPEKFWIIVALAATINSTDERIAVSFDHKT